MNKLTEIQDKIFKKINKIFFNSHIIQNNFFFCSFNFSIGYGFLKYFVDKKNFYLMIKFFLLEIINILLINDYKIYKSTNRKFKKMILTWGNESNINSDFYYDKYFSQKSNIDKNILWVVIYNGDCQLIKDLKNDNVLFIIEKKKNLLKKVHSFLNLIIIFLKAKKLNFQNFLFFFTWHNIFKLKISKLFSELIHKDLELFLIPYEGQPFQLELIKDMKQFPKIKTRGYIHSVPSFPTHLVYKNNFPDELIVSSRDQFEFFKQKLLPKNYSIHLFESARFQRSDPKLMKNKIFLPIDFNSQKKILNELILLYKNEFINYDISDLEIKNHPACKNSKKHLKLIKKIKSFVENLDCKGKNHLKNQSIFVGSTGSIIEALELDLDVFHITEDPVLEVYSQFIWNNIKVSNISDYTYKYEILKKNHSMIFRKGNNFFDKYVEI